MNAPKSAEYREAVARIVDPEAFVVDLDGYSIPLTGADSAYAKANAIIALSGPVSGMDTRPSNANPASSLHGEPTEAEPSAAFQARVLPWMLECFGPVIPFDGEERGDRFLEEVFELLQSGGYDPARVLALRDYVWSRDVGEPAQEAGGVMVTMAAYCIAFGLDMAAAGETELARIWTKVPQIRAKQAAKPTGSALPIAKAEATATEAETLRSLLIEVRDACLYGDDDGIGVTNEPTIDDDLFARICEAVKPTATEAQHAGQWRTIESGPREPRRLGHNRGPLVFLLIPYSRRLFPYADRWDIGYWSINERCWRFTGDDGPYDIAPTHWAPLTPPAAPPSPAPPSSEPEDRA